jgi:DNA ligase D-like protein (predicted ligase)/DNA ligase D-like protein (predicted polymerase)/DNA ligase D-like protein (predicted 3'-phosphoesterase)
MPSRTSQIAQVGKRKLELTNLERVLFPEDHIVKAELIEYYLTLAPTILAHLKGRPLSFVRYPDGIGGESFFQKNRPTWAPPWVDHAVLGETQKDYIIANETASLVWLANLACVELHQMHSRSPHFDKPDYMVFDFDPPEDFSFADIAALALEFKEHLEGFGYHSFVKTTGRKGLHVVAPIEPKWEFPTLFSAAQAAAAPFVNSHLSSVTLDLRKDSRKSKLLLDIYRNRSSQTIISAYSVRGLPGAPVSTPLRWDELESLQTPKTHNLHTVPGRVRDSGDPWETIGAYATELHTQRKAATPAKRPLPAARTYKSPRQLNEYSRKRSFEKTPEPPPEIHPGIGSAFVLHRHHATRLHYDLRLEQKGALASWAIPKGLPPRPGISRLAVKVEDHPLEYASFEGRIPKGEYGGGMMWKFARGRYEVTKEKKDGMYFRLSSPELNAEYRVHHTAENQWLLQRVDSPQIDWLRDRIEPMLAQPASKPPASSDDYFYEVKWDGIRALIALDEGAIRIHGRRGMELTNQFPELLVPDQAFRATSALFDGEIVCLMDDGKPDFGNVIRRMQQTTPGGIERTRGSYPAVCYLFDCLYLDGRPIVNEPLSRRREWLEDAIKKGSPYRLSEVVEEGVELLEAVKQMGLEGIMAKQRSSNYLPGQRSDSWIKIKLQQTLECVIIGYTRGAGEREGTFGALHLGQLDGGKVKYLGKVGTGFDDRTQKAIFSQLQKLTITPRPIRTRPSDDSQSIWVEMKLMCEVRYASITKDGVLREPVFVRLRPDFSP